MNEETIKKELEEYTKQLNILHMLPDDDKRGFVTEYVREILGRYFQSNNGPYPSFTDEDVINDFYALDLTHSAYSLVVGCAKKLIERGWPEVDKLVDTINKKLQADTPPYLKVIGRLMPDGIPMLYLIYMYCTRIAISLDHNHFDWQGIERDMRHFLYRSMSIDEIVQRSTSNITNNITWLKHAGLLKDGGLTGLGDLINAGTIQSGYKFKGVSIGSDEGDSDEITGFSLMVLVSMVNKGQLPSSVSREAFSMYSDISCNTFSLTMASDLDDESTEESA